MIQISVVGVLLIGKSLIFSDIFRIYFIFFSSPTVFSGAAAGGRPDGRRTVALIGAAGGGDAALAGRWAVGAGASARDWRGEHREKRRAREAREGAIARGAARRDWRAPALSA